MFCAVLMYFFHLGCLDPIKELIVGIMEDCIIVKVQSAWLIAVAAASVYEKLGKSRGMERSSHLALQCRSFVCMCVWPWYKAK